MGNGALLLMSAALASDAFAVSVCKGLGARKKLLRTGLICGIWFGIFQAFMPVIGWTIGAVISNRIERFAPYIAFMLLSFLGGKMIYEASASRKSDHAEQKTNDLRVKTMIPLAIATSIDALAAGITFAALHVPILYAVSMIGLVTFFFCQLGAYLGAWVGKKIESKAQWVGGFVLIAIGIKILAEHIFTRHF